MSNQQESFGERGDADVLGVCAVMIAIFVMLAVIGVAESYSDSQVAKECVKAGNEWIDGECRR